MLERLPIINILHLQLVLLKSNTNFDPSTGNYNITAEFQADVFSLFNTFLLINL